MYWYASARFIKEFEQCYKEFIKANKLKNNNNNNNDSKS